MLEVNFPYIFGDRLFNLEATKRFVQIELGTMHFPATEGQKLQLVLGQKLAMPLAGFEQSFGMIDGLRK